ncbi:protein FADD [Pelmatolapia mariae]|uniref:protein FADD n=1 Tax=Pelmatolapia mariae TaxID=158779 RepID=UPI002FE5A142
MSALQFNSVLLEISNAMSADQLNEMKFLVLQEIGKRNLEKIGSGRELFQLFRERGKLSEDNTAFLSKLLKEIKRQDLSDKIDNFNIQPEPDDGLSEEEKAKLKIATEVIAENLGKSWRKLGRKLGLSETKLESISNRHPTDLEETAVELLKEWRKSQGAAAQTKMLIDALRACQLNMTADKVEERL